MLARRQGLTAACRHTKCILLLVPIANFLFSCRMDHFSHFLFIALGVFTGAYGAIVGAGGGFLIVPVLLWYGLNPQEAIGTSLVILFLNSLSGTVSYARQRKIDYHTGFRFALWAIPGTILGIYLSALFSVKTFSFLFGILLLVIALLLLLKPVAPPEVRLLRSESDTGNGVWWKRKTERTLTDHSGVTHSYSYHTLSGILLTFFAGLISNLFGIGGGILRVPAMVHFLGFPAHVAAATSLFILVLSVGFSSVSHVVLGNVRLLLAVTVGVGVVIGAQVGAALAQHIHSQWLVRLLAFALVAVGIRLLTS